MPFRPPRPFEMMIALPRRGWDRRLCVGANRWGGRHPVRPFFRGISRLGDGSFWYALMGLLAIFGGRTGRITALEMVINGWIALQLYRYLKRWTQRPRPFRACPDIIAHIPPLDEFSFPSGHTLHAVSFTVIALDAFPLLALILLPFTLLIGLSRVILGLHYPTDVLAALCMGLILGGSTLGLAHLLIA
ncbi:phosphatase PAP2 family protein [Frateuria aurantia]